VDSYGARALEIATARSLRKLVLCEYTLLALLILAIVPNADLRSIPARGEPAKGSAMSGRNPDRSSFHASVDIKRLNGEFRLIVILVDFTNIKHGTSGDAIQSRIVERMNKYWLEVSHGQFNVTGDTVGWINLGHDEAYYGKDTDPKEPGSDQKADELIADACRLAKDVDFKQYQDIMVIFAGHGQNSDSKNTNLLWPQAWRSGLDVTCGGKTFDNGGYTSEVYSWGTLALGSFTHEFGHTIRLPDLYDTDPKAPDYWKTGVDYVGMWSLMAAGDSGGPDDNGSNPVGLESWSRIKLGWLSSLSVPLVKDGFVQSLNQLGDVSGPRALKLRAAGSTYYLFEARAKVGVDKYLPDSGVLITRIDESKDSGKGIVIVVDCHPETRSIDDATCKVNESWSDASNNIYMKVIGEQGTSYTVAFGSKPITILKVYTAELSLVGLPSSASASVTVDGTEYTNITGSERFVLAFPLGSTHTVTLSHCAIIGEDTRYCATDNTITITKQGIYTIRYETRQYRLHVQTEPSSIAGAYEKWLTAGQTETLGPFDEAVPVSTGIRYFLVGLIVDGAQLSERTTTLLMDEPHTVKVSYVTQYFLKVTSSFGDPKGEGWYTAGDVARYWVTTPYGFLIRRFFISWTGDISSTQPQGALTMTRPYSIEARWRDDYTQLLITLVVMSAAVVVAWLFIGRRRSRKITPTTPVSIVPTEPAPPAESVSFCINCGASLSPGAIFCERCGARQ